MIITAAVVKFNAITRLLAAYVFYFILPILSESLISIFVNKFKYRKRRKYFEFFIIIIIEFKINGTIKKR